MANSGHKRVEMDDELRADNKRPRSLLAFRASSSGLSAKTPMNSTISTPEAHEGDMDTTSSTSASSRSEGEGEKDSSYGSCDSDEMGGAEQRKNIYREYQRQRSSGDHAKFKRVLSSLSEEVEESAQLAALTELCELLSFCTDNSLSNLMADSISPVLVKFARQASNPDVMLLAVRAITYLCDVHSRSTSYLVRHDAVPALCQRLMTIEYMDVAEQCLQALDKLSREQPLACLQSGATVAVLSYIDFFSTSLQRVALNTVVNICKKLPPECPSLMEAVPILCNLLRYEDGQLVENVATCLIKITEQVRHSSNMLDELCKHGLIQQAIHLIHLNSRTTICQPVYSGLIGILVKLASGSIVAFRTLFELNISSTLKDILSTYDLSPGMSSHFIVDRNFSQVDEVLKLLNELLPAISRDQDTLSREKENFLVNQPDLLQKFGMDLLPLLTQVVNSGVNLYVCYGCLSVINKLIYFSNSDILLELLKCINISSFLAGIFTRKDHHVLMIALQIIDNVLKKLSEVYLSSFIKEGVLFAVDALVMPEKCSQFMLQMITGNQFSNDPFQKSSGRDVLRCLCYAFDTSQSPSPSESGTCKLGKDSVHNLAKHVRSNYFATELLNSEEGATVTLQKLKTLSAALTDMVNLSMNNESSTHKEEDFYCILHQIMSQLNGSTPISTFEFLESGIVKSLLSYLSNGQYFGGKTNFDHASDKFYIVEKRFEEFGNYFFSSSSMMGDFVLSALIRKLQSALSSAENFPVMLSPSFKQRNSYATVPYGRCTTYPCLKVQFVRGEEETCLSDYSREVFSVDPFSPLDAIDAYLWPKVTANRIGCVRSASQTCSHSPSSSFQCRSPVLMKSENMSPDVDEMQEDIPNLLQAGSGDPATLGRTTRETSTSEAHTETMEQNQLASLDEDNCISMDASAKLSFYLDGQQLDNFLTLYQAILQKRTKSDHEINTTGNMWSQVYILTFKRAVKHKQSISLLCHKQANCSALLEKAGTYLQYTPFFTHMFSSDVEKSSPAYDILFLLKSFAGINRFRFQLLSREQIFAFAEGRIDNLDNLKVVVSDVLRNEFVNSRLTEKLEQQMRDPLAVSPGGMPSWCSQLMTSCPFLFSFEARCKYFRLAALGQRQVLSSHNNTGGSNGRQQNFGTLPRKKFVVHRSHILESATKMMDLHAHQKVVLEVEYEEEVGTGLGPTLEFYTLLSHEFQKCGLGMWREDHMSLTSSKSLQAGSGSVVSPAGLFPRPWSSLVNNSNGVEFTEVMKKYVLLGQVVAKTLQDGRVLDLPFSKAFYKLILGQDLTVYDIQSFDPGLGTALLEFQAIIERKKYLEFNCGDKSTFKTEQCYRCTRIEDLYLDFTLPGYPDYTFPSELNSKMVNMINLEEYVTLIVDATINSGIIRQVEAFKSGFNQVFPIKHLQILTEEELESLLCGERELWNFNELLDQIKLDHGYTASSPPVINLLDIIREFDCEQQKAFLRFVTGAPSLPRGGLAALNPKLTVVRKHCGNSADDDLPSVMTCANYLKLPPYTSKEKMKEKLLYAITEGQGSFHLS